MPAPPTRSIPRAHSSLLLMTACAAVAGANLSPLPAATVDVATRLGLPAFIASADTGTPARIALGRKLFFDKRLSRDGTIACASCHQPDRAFADGLAIAKGVTQGLGTRNTPSLLNAAFNKSQFWDGRRPDLESQALDPFTNPREHGLADVSSLTQILRRDREYREHFQAAFPKTPDPIGSNQIAQALASFQRTLIAGGSPFGRYYFGGQTSALAPAAVRGLSLFRGPAGCTTCHTIDKTHALFTDDRFHSLTLGLSRLAPRLARVTMRLAQAKDAGTLIDHTVLGEDEIAELGRFAVSLHPRDIGKFRTPSLRNVAETAPYMHNGSVATLEEAVELEVYYRSTQAEHPLVLTAREKADIVEFLRSLSSARASR